MKTLIATAALVTALAAPGSALSPQANLGSQANIDQGTAQSVEPTLVRHRSSRAYGAYGAYGMWRGGYGNAWCQGARDPRDPYICNYMGHHGD